MVSEFHVAGPFVVLAILEQTGIGKSLCTDERQVSI